MKTSNSIVAPSYYDYWYPYRWNQYTYTFPVKKETAVANNEEVLKFAIGIIETLVLNDKPQEALDVIYALREKKYI